MTTRDKFLLHASAPAGTVIVQELSREWRTAGDLALLLIAVELVYYIGLIVQWVIKKIRGQEQRVKEVRREWRSYKRERVIATYRPENDRGHPHYERNH